MASPHRSDGLHSGADADPAPVPPDAQHVEDALPYDAYAGADEAPATIRLRVVPWDVISTLVLITLLIVLATATNWPWRLFGFLSDVCTGETCGPVPYGVDMYIYPVVWGGVGAAIAAAGVGPFVSLLKGWYMSFWPVLSLAILMVASVAGDILTIFSQPYWR
ncbi:hypothetical protein [Mycobacterium shigaense]|uniref:Uncharacterized protein n=1 Tax=Mycobacterium shigaense TaxID=722731 RepID=A0A1Z4EHE6_9MYCO|nr:hypothetical protein [Mycobacterium shigaense]MEA1124507.1 hypothetical protein [Mycobacterium shigaense]PRI14019.1 hypothetical protein B2J96_17990 [Mycobacterium shigaense]BAX92387.1 hypothetical protein MSG_02238 [Mycobacterium shigaense]